MLKTDIKELRKALKAERAVIPWIYQLYLNSENDVVWENVSSLYDMEESEQARHMTIFSKVLSPSLGKDSFSVDAASGSDDLLAFRKSEQVSDDASFIRESVQMIPHTDPLYICAAKIIYDIPTKSEDRWTLEDGEYVYESILFVICPAKLSAPSLGFENDQVTELVRRWQIGNPAGGFLYPAFTDRQEDRNAYLLYMKKPIAQDAAALFFPNDAPADLPIEQLQQDALKEFVGACGATIETAASFAEGITHEAAEGNEILSREDITRIAEEAGIEMSNAEEAYDSTIGGLQLAVNAVGSAFTVIKTDACEIRVPADQSDLVKVEVINGRKFIAVPADGTVTVNGAEVIPD